MTDYPNNNFAFWAMDWLVFKKKAKNLTEIVKRIKYDLSSVSSAKAGNRPFADEKISALIHEYKLHPYWEAFQKRPLENPFDSELTLNTPNTQKPGSINARLDRIELEMQKQADLIDTLYKKIKQLS